MELDTIKKLFQSGRINFLFGSGLSRPYLITLGSIEKWLTDLSLKADDVKTAVVRASIYRRYFNEVIWLNHRDAIAAVTPAKKADYDKVMKAYQSFLETMNLLVTKRNMPLLSKKVNVFTTNIDMFMERAANNRGIELNDGFSGHLETRFEEDNFSKLLTKESVHYQKVSEIPAFNYIKIHGSSNWKEIGVDHEITSDDLLEQVNATHEKVMVLGADQFVDVTDESKTIDELIGMADAIVSDPFFDIAPYKAFMVEYEKIVMINPNKHKFSTSVLDMHFYELLRIFSNALEQPNALLISAGFSFADEHIAQLTVRAANNNPTLQVLVLAYDIAAKAETDSNISRVGTCRNNNISILSPEDVTMENGPIPDLTNFDFESINEKVLKAICNTI